MIKYLLIVLALILGTLAVYNYLDEEVKNTVDTTNIGHLEKELTLVKNFKQKEKIFTKEEKTVENNISSKEISKIIPFKDSFEALTRYTIREQQKFLNEELILSEINGDISSSLGTEALDKIELEIKGTLSKKFDEKKILAEIRGEVSSKLDKEFLERVELEISNSL